MGRANTMLGAEGARRLLSNIDTLYFVGIGGVGMASLARLATARGFLVSGEDIQESETVLRLKESGIRITQRFEGLPCGRVAVIFSAAIGSRHPALTSGAPQLSRADLLAYFMADSKERVTVAGMHGKSTVTAMLDRVLVRVGLNPTTVSGAALEVGECLRLGGSEIFLAEACEYADSFLSLSPTVALALNMEHEHPDYFSDITEVERSFAAYLGRASRAVVLPAEDDALRRLAPQSRIRLFGGKELYAEKMEHTAQGEKFLLCSQGKTLAAVSLSAIGSHTIMNALAALRAANELGVGYEDGAVALSGFRAPRRRLELRLQRQGVLWYDDYAHHPSEIRASLLALRQRTAGRLICAFQPHTYSRMSAFLDGFADVLVLADRVILLPIYAAREQDTLGTSSELLAERIGEKASAAPSIGAAAELLLGVVREGDTVVVMGAGDIDRIFALI